MRWSTRLPRGPRRRLARSSARSASFAGGHNFDVAVFGVAHPAAQVEFAGFALDKPAKANTLHTALNEEMKNH